MGYATSATLVGHAVATSEEVIARLHYEMTKDLNRDSDSILLKVIGRLYPSLLRWGLDSGLRLQRNLTLMALGDYHDAHHGTYVPSIGY